MSSSPWAALAAEFDRWAEAGRSLTIWLRDDDAVAPSAALERLSALAERFEAPVLLAVIPMLAEPGLAPALRGMPALRPCQHGCWHRNHAPAGAKKSEFGANRPAAEVDAEIVTARMRLADLLGETAPVFVPPWNRIGPVHAARLGALGFAGLSCFRGHRLDAAAAPTLLDTDIDVMDWRGGRVGRAHDALLAETLALLAARRGALGGDDRLGLLLHHRDHDETAWSFLERFLAMAAAHPAVAPGPPIL